jgi:beta-phosphoglucomutase-like phosphatase (HAD superfamily)
MEFYRQGKLQREPRAEPGRLKEKKQVIRAVFFDLDGLLADTEDLHTMAYEIVAEKTGIRMSREYIQSFIGRATGENISQIIRDFSITGYSFDELLKLRFDSYFEVVQRVPIRPMAGALECIRRVQAKGLKRALVTLSMKEHALTVLENISNTLRIESGDGSFDLMSFFDVMIFGDQITNPKPDPEIYLQTLSRVGLGADGCVALEDSEAGVVSAKKAGLYVIAVPNAHTRAQSFEMADLILPSLAHVATMEFLR